MHEPRPDYAAMTVNERLFAAGLLEDFDSAIEIADRATAVEMLARVDIADQAEWIVDTTLANPAKYGFPRAT